MTKKILVPEDQLRDEGVGLLNEMLEILNQPDVKKRLGSFRSTRKILANGRTRLTVEAEIIPSSDA